MHRLPRLFTQMFPIWARCMTLSICLFHRQGATFQASAALGAGSGQIMLDDVVCAGQEASLFDCTHSPWTNNNCAHSEDVGVTCTGGGGGTNSTFLPPLLKADVWRLKLCACFCLETFGTEHSAYFVYDSTQRFNQHMLSLSLYPTFLW
jgi:hypothetical protein